TMPGHVAHRAQNILNADGLATKGAKVLLLGVTYKPDIADQRESPAVDLAKALIDLGAEVIFHDPYVEQWAANGTALRRVEDVDVALREADLAILVQNHSEYDVDAMAKTA